MKLPPDDDSAFGKFQKLARRLFAVPKRELDQKLAERQRRKRKSAKAK